MCLGIDACGCRYDGSHSFPSRGPADSARVDRTRERRTTMSVENSPPAGEKEPGKKRYRRRLTRLALKAAIAAAVRALFEWLWP